MLVTFLGRVSEQSLRLAGFLWTEGPPSPSLTGEVAIAYEVLTGAFLSYIPTTNWQLLHPRLGTLTGESLCP